MDKHELIATMAASICAPLLARYVSGPDASIDPDTASAVREAAVEQAEALWTLIVSAP